MLVAVGDSLSKGDSCYSCRSATVKVVSCGGVGGCDGSGGGGGDTGGGDDGGWGCGQEKSPNNHYHYQHQKYNHQAYK